MSNPTLSIVTGLRNRQASFRRLVDSIEKNTAVSWELIVSDASDEPINEAGLPPNVRIIPERPRLGHCRGYNRAFRECSGEFTIWANDDAEVCPGYDVESISFLERHPTTGMVALHYHEGDGRFRTNSAWGCIYPNFGCLRTELGNRIGWFGDDLYFYGGDNRICFEVLLQDLGVNDVPAAKIIHHPVNDAMRQENQLSRMRDNQILQAKYMPLMSQWQSAYQRHFVPSGHIPWSHGVPPKGALVGA